MSPPATYRGAARIVDEGRPSEPPERSGQLRLTARVKPHMSRDKSMRHNLPVALFVTAMLLLVPVASAKATLEPRHSRVPAKICPIPWQRGPWFVKRLIRCAAVHYEVPGGMSKALYIADRESNYHPRAYNAYSGALGIYQHLSRYWPGRAQAYGFKGWSGFNARANIIVTMRMVKSVGWYPWGG
jgi:hypothetical protein